MGSNITFSPDGWADHLYWQAEDKKTFRRIDQLLQDILRSGPASGIGKPEPLRHAKEWSRRIDEKTVWCIPLRMTAWSYCPAAGIMKTNKKLCFGDAPYS